MKEFELIGVPWLLMPGPARRPSCRMSRNPVESRFHERCRLHRRRADNERRFVDESFDRPGAIDSFPPRPLENFCVEGLEFQPMIEMLEVCEFMAERVDEAGIFKRLAGSNVAESNLDRAI